MIKFFKSSRQKGKLAKIKNEYISSRLNADDEPMAVGNRCEALTVWDFPIPTGICENPVSEELRECVQKDKLGQLLGNPINRCVFCKTNNYCFFGGLCNKKMPISETLVDEYRSKTKQDIERKFGPRSE